MSSHYSNVMSHTTRSFSVGSGGTAGFLVPLNHDGSELTLAASYAIDVVERAFTLGVVGVKVQMVDVNNLEFPGAEVRTVEKFCDTSDEAIFYIKECDAISAWGGGGPS